MNKDYKTDAPTVIMLSSAVSKMFMDNMRRETAKLGINSSYRPILVHLAKNEGITQLDLVKLTHLTAPSISVTLRKMEADALIRKETDSKDMRQIRLYLTDKGKRLDEKLRRMAQSFDNMYMEGIGELEINTAKECLKKIKENILKYEGE